MSWTNSVRAERERGVPVRGRRLVLRLTRGLILGNRHRPIPGECVGCDDSVGSQASRGSGLCRRISQRNLRCQSPSSSARVGGVLSRRRFGGHRCVTWRHARVLT